MIHYCSSELRGAGERLSKHCLYRFLFSIKTIFSACKDTVFHNLDTFKHEREDLLLTYGIGCHKKCLGGMGKQSYGVVP